MEETVISISEAARNGSALSILIALIAVFGSIYLFINSIISDEDDRIYFHDMLERRRWWETYGFLISKVENILSNFYGKRRFSPNAFNHSIGVAIGYPWVLIAISIWLDPRRPFTYEQRNYLLCGALTIIPIIGFLYYKYGNIKINKNYYLDIVYGFFASSVFLAAPLLLGSEKLYRVKQCASTQYLMDISIQTAANSYFNCLHALDNIDFFIVTAVSATAVSLNSILTSTRGIVPIFGGMLGLAVPFAIFFDGSEITISLFAGVLLITFIIPFLNGTLDFISMGISRTWMVLLQRDAAQKSWKRASKHVLYDIALAFAILAIFSLILWSVVNFPNEFPSIVSEWKGYGNAPWSAPAFPWSMMFITVLIPTGIHLLFAILALSLVPLPFNPSRLLEDKRVSFLERIGVIVWISAKLFIVIAIIFGAFSLLTRLISFDGSTVFWNFVYDLPSSIL